jgi:hypothetical protein
LEQFEPGAYEADFEELLEQDEPGEYEPDLEDLLRNQTTGNPNLRIAWQNTYGAFSRSVENSTDCGKIVMPTKPRNGIEEPKHEVQD